VRLVQIQRDLPAGCFAQQAELRRGLRHTENDVVRKLRLGGVPLLRLRLRSRNSYIALAVLHACARGRRRRRRLRLLNLVLGRRRWNRWRSRRRRSGLRLGGDSGGFLVVIRGRAFSFTSEESSRTESWDGRDAWRLSFWWGLASPTFTTALGGRRRRRLRRRLVHEHTDEIVANPVELDAHLALGRLRAGLVEVEHQSAAREAEV
jgi:hypothetical protein